MAKLWLPTEITADERAGIALHFNMHAMTPFFAQRILVFLPIATGNLSQVPRSHHVSVLRVDYRRLYDTLYSGSHDRVF